MIDSESKSITSPLKYYLKGDVNNYKLAISIFAYLIVICVCLIYASEILEGGQNWKTGDWLINYEGGLVRRGLIGQVLFELSRAGFDLLWTTFFLQTTIYFLLAHYTLKLFFRTKREITWLMLLFSPAFVFLFPFYDPFAGFRKEILLFLSFCLLCCGLLDNKISHKHVWTSILVYSFAVFSHEMSSLCLPYFAYLFFKKKDETTNNIFLFLYTAIYSLLAAGGIILAIACPGNLNVKNEICNSLLASGLQGNICDGAIEWLQYDFKYGIKSVANYIRINLIVYPLLLLLASMPIMLTSWWKKNIMLIVVAFVSFVPLYVVAMDWGRWIHIYISMLSIFLLFDSINTATKMRRVPSLCMLAYATVWSIPHYLATLPIFGMIDVSYRILKKLKF